MLDSVLWNLRKDRKRSDEENARRLQQLEFEAQEDPCFHIYDEINYHDSGGDDPDEWFFTQPVQTEEYTIVLAIGSKEVTETAHYIPDSWYEKR